MRFHSIALLSDAWQALNLATHFVAGWDLERYRASALHRSAVERQLSIAGEALSVLRRTDPELAGRVPHLDRAVGLRNIIVHDYASLDPEIIWMVATYHAPSLSSAIETILSP